MTTDPFEQLLAAATPCIPRPTPHPAAGPAGPPPKLPGRAPRSANGSNGSPPVTPSATAPSRPAGTTTVPSSKISRHCEPPGCTPTAPTHPCTGTTTSPPPASASPTGSPARAAELRNTDRNDWIRPPVSSESGSSLASKEGLSSGPRRRGLIVVTCRRFAASGGSTRIRYLCRFSRARRGVTVTTTAAWSARSLTLHAVRR